MNCRESDIAMFVRSPDGFNLGRLVQVVSSRPWCEPPQWTCIALGHVSILADKTGARRVVGPGAGVAVPDALLTPLRYVEGGAMAFPNERRTA